MPGMILSGLGLFFISWYYSHKIKFKKPDISFRDIFKGGLRMVRLGFFIVLTGFVASATLYIVRAFIAKELTLDSVGYFQASWMISKTYINIVLTAMLADFFPRLSATNQNISASNKLINEQLEMALIIGIPMIVALCAFSKTIIYTLYSSEFAASVILLQWQIAGSIFTLISWPLGILFLARGRGVFIMINDSSWSLFYLSFIYFGWNLWGFNVLGIAFVLASAINAMMVIFEVKYLGQFSFSKTNMKYIVAGLIIILVVFLNTSLNESLYPLLINIFILTATVCYSYYKLREIIDFKKVIVSRFSIYFKKKDK